MMSHRRNPTVDSPVGLGPAARNALKEAYKRGLKLETLHPLERAGLCNLQATLR